MTKLIRPQTVKLIARLLNPLTIIYIYNNIHALYKLDIDPQSATFMPFLQYNLHF